MVPAFGTPLLSWVVRRSQSGVNWSSSENILVRPTPGGTGEIAWFATVRVRTALDDSEQMRPLYRLPVLPMTALMFGPLIAGSAGDDLRRSS